MIRERFNKLISGILITVSLLLYGFERPEPSASRKEATSSPVPESTEFRPAEYNPSRRLLGQTIYVPVYSSIYHFTDKNLHHLTATVSLRNISMKQPIIFTRIDYYDTNGKLLRSYLDKPFELGKMATKDFVVSEKDLKGGTGANFIVEWESPVKVAAPLIESVMIGTDGTRAFAFTSRGKEIESH